MGKAVVFTVALLVTFGGLSCLPMSSSASASSTSSAGGKKQQTTNVYINNQVSPSNTQQQSATIYQQQQPAERGAGVRNFAVKSYGRIVEDNSNGGGEHLNSLILLLENEGVERKEALPLIKRALRKSKGSAEAFGNEIVNSL
jgi:hypothetical protein